MKTAYLIGIISIVFAITVFAFDDLPMADDNGTEQIETDEYRIIYRYSPSTMTFSSHVIEAVNGTSLNLEMLEIIYEYSTISVQADQLTAQSCIQTHAADRTIECDRHIELWCSRYPSDTICEYYQFEHEMFCLYHPTECEG